jgi:CRP-like cAMP-binding protein
MMIDLDILLAWGATYKKLSPEEILFKEGDACRFYYQVVSGQMRWVNINEEGKEYLQTLIEPGECIGELPLFDGGVFAATAVANKATDVLRLHQPVFHQLLKSQPEIHFSFTRLLTQRLRFKFFLLKEVASHEPENIITALLKYLKEKGDHVCANCNQIKLTRKQIAEMTGLRVETVIRVMRNLNEKGFLQIQKGKVYYGDKKEGVVKTCTA